MNSLDKVNKLIQKELSALIVKEVEFSEMVLVSISRVITTPDTGLIRVFIDCLPIDKGTVAIKELYQFKKVLREKLAKKIRFRRVPKLSFYIESCGVDN